ncbi:APC family permease [Rickettsia typhi]|uniref:Arginine/agmatine antiporter n=2 Tax=Rickettsia typhi TaxID=785 RepID=Q68WP9_RICTY|nr:amino acid permease [Rickettsia typhi]AAU03943.1 putrescine-ornithine antiporter [Rickettsia typhi str. Wilmington]AFE54324.1 putrescine-ornithine antiporter [Rickettsia typhi str. TH1527]AFE55164.1 putrescine-ornithine antiporter [Rickettsia typhi str. B9991CWPP]
MSQKLSFWSVFALVTGSQIGTSVFILPLSLAPFGVYSIWGWVLSLFGAMSIALVFSCLCTKFPKTGGPHVYVRASFGETIAFFTGWTYWIISFVSTSIVVISAIGYLTPFFKSQKILDLILQLILLAAIAILNLKGPKIAGKIEFYLTLLKFVPLLVVGLAALSHFNIDNIVIAQEIENLTIPTIMGRVALLTFWGFIGIECATTTAGTVKDPAKTIPRAIIIGTCCVAFLYIINSIGIIGLIPASELINSKAPYADAATLLFGGTWSKVITVIASVICIGTLNAWVLTSGQIALGLAEDGLLPQFFAKKNSNNAPTYGIIVSCLGITPLLFFTSNNNFAQQITQIIDFSVIAFLFVYLICSLAFLKLIFSSKENFSYYYLFVDIISIIFCIWVIYKTPFETLIIACSFTILGIPVYYGWYRLMNRIKL